MARKRQFPDTLFVTVEPSEEEKPRPGLLAHRSVEAAYDEPVTTTMLMAVYSIERIIEVRADVKTLKSTKP